MASGICFPIALNLARHAFLIGPMDSDGPCWAQWKVIGYARKNMQVKFERKSFEMNDVSVFCQVGKMQTATEY